MADEVFRPQPVTQSDVSNNPLEGVQNVQKAAANEGIDTGKAAEAGVAVSGAIPPQLQAIMNKQTQQENTGTVKQLDETRGPQVRETPSIPQIRMTGSSTLEDLVSRLPADINSYDEIRLPSLGKFYNGDDGPVDGVLHIRPMTGAEEQILATPRYVKKGEAVNMIINQCLRENYNSQNLITADRTYILIYLRGISYTNLYDVEVRCPFTDRQFPFEINLNDLELDLCPDDFNANSLTGTLPNSGFSFSYRLSTGLDEQKIQNRKDEKTKHFESAVTGDDTLLYRTVQLLNDIEGLTNKNELLSLMKRLPINDVAHLRNTINEPPFGVDTKVEIISPYAAQEFEIDLPLESNFFFPRRKTIQQAS